MQRATKSELQMLREVAWLLLPCFDCPFCRRKLLNRPHGMTFGHRRHAGLSVKLTVHHKDRNRDNNIHENLVLAHSLCHRLYHAEDRRRNDPADDQ